MLAKMSYFSVSRLAVAAFGYRLPMNTIICGISALRFWRMPPWIALIMTEPEEEYRNLGFSSVEEFARVRERMALESPLAKACADGKRWNAAGEHARNIRAAASLLGQCMDFPIDILVCNPSECKRSGFVIPRLWSYPLPPGSSFRLTDEVSVVTPEFALLQLAATLPLNQCLLIASEFFGSYSSYRVPRTLATWLEPALAQRRANCLDLNFYDWVPCVIDGKLCDLWKHEPLVTPGSLKTVAKLSESSRGAARALKIADLVAPGAASPLEFRAGLLFGLPTAYGGLGHTGLIHNQEVRLGRGSRSLAKRQRCYCDLYWSEGVDLEIQSKLVHENEASFLSDSERMAALLSEGIAVLPVTAAHLNDRPSLLEVSNTLAKLRGIKPPSRTRLQEKRSVRLFEDLKGLSGDCLERKVNILADKSKSRK